MKRSISLVYDSCVVCVNWSTIGCVLTAQRSSDSLTLERLPRISRGRMDVCWVPCNPQGVEDSFGTQHTSIRPLRATESPMPRRYHFDVFQFFSLLLASDLLAFFESRPKLHLRVWMLILINYTVD